MADAMLIAEKEPEVRYQYTEMVARLIKENHLSGLALLLNVTCRNPYQSELLDALCRLSLLKHHLQQGKRFPTVKLDNPFLVDAVAQLLKQYDNDDCTIDCQIRKPKRLSVLLVNLVKSVYCCLSDLFWSRYYRLKIKPSQPILFIDTFLMSNSIDADGHYRDRYYTGHEKFLNSAEKQKRWFAPTLISIRKPADYRAVFSRVKSADVNFLIQEAWLEFGDYLYSFYQSLLLPFKVQKVPAVEGMDLSALIKKEAWAQVGSFELLKVVSKYRFIRRLAKQQVVICGAVDWQENQVVDRALNMAFKTYYPGTTVHGYQGFMVPEYYACAQPAEFEQELDTLPDVIHVMGRAGHALRADAAKSLNTRLSPAFRFSYLFDVKRRSSEEPIILVSLPITISECDKLIEAALVLLDSLDPGLTLLIKPHPSYTTEHFFQLVPKARNSRLNVTELNMKQLLEQIAVMISSTSSSCVEAVAVGVPVAIIGNLSGVTMNPIPDLVPAELFRVFYNNQQLLGFIDDALKRKAHSPIVEQLFQPVDEAGTKALFTCPQQD